MDDFFVVVPTLEFAGDIPIDESGNSAYLVVPSLINAEELGKTKPASGFSISAAADDGYGKNLPNTRLRGSWSEIRFALDGLEHDLIIGKPYTDEAFDVFVMPRMQPQVKAGKRLKIFAVQIRSSHTTFRAQGRRKDWFQVSLVHGYAKEPYKRGDFDFLAAYIGPHKAWYIVPFDEIEGLRAIQLRTGDPEPSSKWEKFRERWDLLGGKR